MRTRPLLSLISAAVLAALPAMTCAEPPADSSGAQQSPDLRAANAVGLAAEARIALRELDEDAALSGVDRQSEFETAIAALSGLYQLHGALWARDELARLRSRSDCPKTHVGFSADGTVSLSITPLDLSSPDYSGYTILLCTLEAQRQDALSLEPFGPLTVKLKSGETDQAEQLGPDHPLWQRLGKMSSTFAPHAVLHPGVDESFKQVLHIDSARLGDITSVTLRAGDVTISVPY
jgi:hypothetical protein